MNNTRPCKLVDIETLDLTKFKLEKNKSETSSQELYYKVLLISKGEEFGQGPKGPQIQSSFPLPTLKHFF